MKMGSSPPAASAGAPTVAGKILAKLEMEALGEERNRPFETGSPRALRARPSEASEE